MKKIAIIVAGGSSVRMGKDIRKPYLHLDGIPILARTIAAFNSCNDIDGIYVVVPEGDMPFCRRNILSRIRMKKPIDMVGGGRERQQSVYHALAVIEDRSSLIVVHDGVRPFITPNGISRCIAGAEPTGACITAVPVQETLKRIQFSDDSRIEKTIDRKDIWIAQTPQVFSYELILRAHASAIENGFSGTDDASLVERLGRPVRVVEGSRFNIKITTPDDLLFAEAICRMEKKACASVFRQ
ncbi:MAG: 2-C-methyl-D-erythritol 4-phosphate cytidylyltransferase [Desulfobacterales bacterium]